MAARTDPEKEHITPRIIEEFEQLANEFTSDLSIVLLPGLQTIYMALVGIWVMLTGLKLMKGKADAGDIFRDTLYVFIAYLLLFSKGNILVSYLFEAAMTVLGSAASMIINVGAQAIGTTEASGFSTLAISVEEGITKVMQLAYSISLEWSITNPFTALYAVVLVLPYILLVIAYVSQIMIAIFRLVLLVCISTFLMLAYGYEWGREMAKEGIKTLLASFLALMGSTAAVSIVIYGVTRLNIGQDSMDTSDISLLTAPYVLAVILGWCGTALLMEGTAQANSIAKSSLTNNAAGVMTAGIAGTGWALAKKAASGASLPAKFLARKGVQKALERYKRNFVDDR